MTQVCVTAHGLPYICSLRPTVSADFPRTLDQRVYHLGLRAGEVANRIVRAPAVVLPAMRDWPFLRTVPTLTLTLTTDIPDHAGGAIQSACHRFLPGPAALPLHAHV